MVTKENKKGLRKKKKQSKFFFNEIKNTQKAQKNQ